MTDVGTTIAGLVEDAMRAESEWAEDMITAAVLRQIPISHTERREGDGRSLLHETRVVTHGGHVWASRALRVRGVSDG